MLTRAGFAVFQAWVWLRSARLRLIAVVGALVLGSLGPLALTAAASEPVPRSVTLELAPEALGELRTSGSLMIAAGRKGREIHVLDTAKGSIRTFLESGEEWGKPVTLRDGRGVPLIVAPPRFHVAGDHLAVSGMRELYLFELDGELVASLPLFGIGDIAGRSAGEWAVSLVNLPVPRPPGDVLGGDDEEDSARLVILDDELRFSERGFLAEEGVTSGSAAAGRSLRLAWGGNKLYAAELANYRVYELDRDLERRAEYRDPELTFEEGRGEGASAEIARQAAQQELQAQAEARVRRQGRNLLKRDGGPAEVKAEAYHYHPVIRDIAWDPSSYRLILLLNSGVVGERSALDLLDPATGEVRRIFFVPPEGFPNHYVFSQIVVGRRHLWLRNNKGDSPTFRLGREVLAEGLEIKLPDIELPEGPEPAPQAPASR